MPCTITVSVVEEGVTGDIGDDWRYAITARVFDAAETITGSGRVVVDEHVLKPGTSQAPPKVAGVKIAAGECGSRVRVELQVEATEVDWLVDDPGSGKTVLAVDCPGPGKPPLTVEPTISVKVHERPRLVQREATFTVKLRLVAACL